MSNEAEFGWTVEHWEWWADHPDWGTEGHYRHKENAEAWIAGEKAASLAKLNAAQAQRHRTAKALYEDHVALVSAGRRSAGTEEPPVEPEPITELGANPRYRWRVVPLVIEYEDES